MLYACIVQRCQVDRVKILTASVHGIHMQTECRLSVAQIFVFQYQSRVDDGMKIERTSNMVKIFGRIYSELSHCPVMMDQ